MAIHTGQYASFDMSASLYVILNQSDGDKGALLLPETGHAFIIVAALLRFKLFFD